MEPWIENYNAVMWIPGTLLGVTAGLWGGLGGSLAPRGKCRRLVLGSAVALVALSVVLLGTGVVAWLSGQPYGIWYGLALPGAIGLAVLGPLLPVMRHRYREAELRRMSASDI